jgi:hypothetical protein
MTRNKKDLPFVTEDTEQSNLVIWLNLKKIVFTSVPNESKRSIVYGAKLKRMGLQKGFPDLLIFTRSKLLKKYDYVGIAIEMKSLKGRIRPEQHIWLNNLSAEKWLTQVCFGMNDAVDFLETWGY